MPENAVSPFNITDAVLKIKRGAAAEVGFSQHVSNVVCTPTSSTTTWKGMKPEAVFQFAGRALWSVALTFAQDWSDKGLSKFLFDAEGDTVTLTFAPVTGGAGFAVSVIVVPGAYGGAVDSVGEATATLPVKGRPTLVTAVAAVS
jgi:hypothetical protein